MAAQSSVLRPQPLWFVQAAGRVWGPYPQARLSSFMQEGRLTSDSLVATQAHGPFGPAGRRRELGSLFIPSEPQTARVNPTPVKAGEADNSADFTAFDAAYAPLPETPNRSRSAPERSTAAAPAARAQPSRSLLVWAALSSTTYLRFETTLGTHGQFVGIRAGLWLVRTPLNAAGLRNALSRRLRSDDALFVVEAPLDRAAWFNLDGTAERDLRELWAASERP